MCSVEIPRCFELNNVMRRVNRTEPSPPKRASVRRVLFGAPLDHEATAWDLNRHLQEMQAEARSRWNFDFGTESPLHGRYEWRRVDVRSRESDQEISGPEGSAGTSPTMLAHEIEVLQVPDPCRAGAEVRGESERPAAEDSTQQQATLKSSVQKRVTDYMCHRKRPSSASLKSPIASSSVMMNKLRKREAAPATVAAAAASSSSSPTAAALSRSSSAASSSPQPPT